MNYEYQFSRVIRISDVYKKPEAEVLAAVPANKDVVRFGIPKYKEPYLAMDCKTVLVGTGEFDQSAPRLVLKSKTKRVMVGEWEITEEINYTSQVGIAEAERRAKYTPEIFRIEEREA